jgi:serine/threonine protein kinase
VVASSRQSEFEPGDRIGRYELLCVLRQDKATITWLARQRGTRRFEKNVVLRTLLPAFAKDPGMIAVLAQGARAVQSLDDPHIVRSLDMGDHAGLPFVIFELVDGELVEALLAHAAGPPPLDVGLTIADDACAALERAHDAGVVHGCLSPGNVVITASGLSKVSGFGAAHVRAQDPSGRLARALGEDPRFVAPELALGAQLEVRTDVWGIGSLLHALVSGAPPDRGVASLAPSVPAVIQDLVTRAVATRPEDRFPSVRDLRRALTAAAKEANLELSQPRVAGIVGERLGSNAVARRAAIDRAVVEAARREEARALLTTPPTPEARRTSSIPPKWIPPHIDTLKPPADSAAIPPPAIIDPQPSTPLRPPPDTVRMESMRPDAFEDPPPTTKRFGLLSQPPPAKSPTPVPPAPKERTLPPPNNNTPVPPPKLRTPAPPAGAPAGALSPMPFPATSPSPMIAPSPSPPQEPLPRVMVATDPAPTPPASPAATSSPPAAGAPAPIKSPLLPPASPRRSPIPPATVPLAGGKTAFTSAPEPAADGAPPPPSPVPAPGLASTPAYGPLPPLRRPPMPSHPPIVAAPPAAPSDPPSPGWPQSAPPPAEVLEARASSRGRSPGLSLGIFAFALVAAIAMVLVLRWQRTSPRASAAHTSTTVRRDVPPPVTNEPPPTTADSSGSPTTTPVATAIPVDPTPTATDTATAATSEVPTVPRPSHRKKKHKDAGAAASSSAASTSTSTPAATATSTSQPDDTPGF